ncbi:MAG: ABC-2 transporter permease [Arachnia sp.]
MSEFGAMLRLDAFNLISLRRVVPIYGVLVVAFAVMWGGVMALPLVAALGVMTSTVLFCSGPADRRNLLSGTLPVRRRVVMLSHYAIVAVGTVLVAALTVVVTLAADTLRRRPDEGLLAAGAATCGGVFLVLSVLLPLQVRWGGDVARWVAMPASLVLVIVLTLARDAGWAPAPAQTAGFDAVAPWGLLVLGLAALSVSWAVAVKVYERQDH